MPAAVMRVEMEEGHTSALETFAHPSCLVLVLVPGRARVHVDCHRLYHANMHYRSAAAPPYPWKEAQPQRPRLQDPVSIVVPSRNRPVHVMKDDPAHWRVPAHRRVRLTAPVDDVSFLEGGAGCAAVDQEPRDSTRRQHELPQVVDRHGMFWTFDVSARESPHCHPIH